MGAYTQFFCSKTTIKGGETKTWICVFRIRINNVKAIIKFKVINNQLHTCGESQTFSALRQVTKTSNTTFFKTFNR